MNLAEKPLDWVMKLQARYEIVKMYRMKNSTTQITQMKLFSPIFMLGICSAVLAAGNPSQASQCSARVKAGTTLSREISPGTPVSFHSWMYSNTGDDPRMRLYYVGHRMLMAKVSDLYEVSPGCSSLPKFSE